MTVFLRGSTGMGGCVGMKGCVMRGWVIRGCAMRGCVMNECVSVYEGVYGVPQFGGHDEVNGAFQ